VVGGRKRHGALPAVPQAFRLLLDEHQGRLRGTAESAHDLSDLERETLERALAARTGKQVALEVRTNPELLGGVRVTLDGIRYDGSLRGRLDSARKRLQTADLGS
ncbi:MAG TPA: F0F1 ATP synthase subunit delta, partial [Planctomycetota bacterium]